MDLLIISEKPLVGDLEGIREYIVVTNESRSKSITMRVIIAKDGSTNVIYHVNAGSISLLGTPNPNEAITRYRAIRTRVQPAYVASEDHGTLELEL